MTQYINKDALVAEITSLKVKYECGWNCAIDKVLEHIEDLEVKEVNLEEEIDKIDDVIPGKREDIEYIAKYFFELGLKMKQKGE